MVYDNLYSVIVTNVSDALRTLVPRKQPSFQALFKGTQWHTAFQLVLKLMTLSDLERHNGCCSALVLPSLAALGLVVTHWLKLDPYCLQQKCSTMNLVFVNI